MIKLKKTTARPIESEYPENSFKALKKIIPQNIKKLQ
jgi:hypothetical protein